MSKNVNLDEFLNYPAHVVVDLYAGILVMLSVILLFDVCLTCSASFNCSSPLPVSVSVLSSAL